MRPPDGPLVSCLCVTENRAFFMPWLRWGFERQTWPHKELVIVDSSLASVPERPQMRVVPAPPGAAVAAKRNQALAAARGSIVAWFDDDDWQHPARLQTVVPLLRGDVCAAGPQGSWLVDLFGDDAWRYPGFDGAILFNGSAFVTEAARAVAFDVRRRRASDTIWLGEILRRQRVPAARTADATFFWLHHGANLSLSPRRTDLRKILRRTALSEIRATVGADAWGDTDAELEALRARILGARRAPPP